MTAAIDPHAVSPNILMPLPDHDFDPTESSVPWKVCTSRGWTVTISTQQGTVAEADLYKLNSPLPGLLGASRKAQAAYEEMTRDSAYKHPIPYADIDPQRYQALVLPGGDAPRMRQYLESQVIQAKVLEFFRQGKLIGAICHGLLVLARTIDPRTGQSVLYGYKVTALPRSLDRFASWLDSKLLKHGYLMYPCCVADEVQTCLKHSEHLSNGRSLFSPYVVVDGNLITARWYVDAESFAQRFAETLEERLHIQKGCA